MENEERIKRKRVIIKMSSKRKCRFPTRSRSGKSICHEKIRHNKRNCIPRTSKALTVELNKQSLARSGSCSPAYAPFLQCCLPSKMAERQMPLSGPTKMTLGRDVKCMKYGVASTTSIEVSICCAGLTGWSGSVHYKCK